MFSEECGRIFFLAPFDALPGWMNHLSESCRTSVFFDMRVERLPSFVFHGQEGKSDQHCVIQ